MAQKRGCLRSCLGRVTTAFVLFGVAYAGWRWGPAVFPRLEAALAGTAQLIEKPQVAPSPTIATETMGRVDGLRTGDGPEVISLGDTEVSSLMRYGFPTVWPASVRDPSVRMNGDRVTMNALVAVDAVPEFVSLRELRRLLPDTVSVRVEGTLSSLGDGQSTLYVEGARAGVVPLPGLAIPEVLRALGREDVEGLPSNAVLIPLPAGLTSAYVRGDSLVLVGER